MTATQGAANDDAPPRRFEDLPPAAQRALQEAEARRHEIDAKGETLPREIDGRGGLEPTRYEDWEIKGIACDF
nr:DUF1674 domain-containing protein [Stappia sp. TSB10P1A]